MGDTKTNNQIIDSLVAVRNASLTQGVITSGGAGKAYHSVAQSTAIAVQDAANYLRNLSTLSSTAVGVAMSQLLATGDTEKYAPVIQAAQSLVASGAATFKTIGFNAADVLNHFPPHEKPKTGGH